MRVLCFGDSNTYGFDPRSSFGGRYPAECRWVDLLARNTGWEVLNGGENGREIPRGEYPLRHFRQMLSGCLPLDMLLVMLGGNDLLQGRGASEVAVHMEVFLSRLPMDRADVLLIAPPPMRYGAWATEERILNASAQLAQEYRSLARRLGTRFADAGQWGIDLTFDGVHFSEAGHRAFAEGLSIMLEQFIKKSID